MSEPLTFASTFTGIAGFELGFARSGIETSVMVEYEDSANRVLATHFPNTPLMGDIFNVHGSQLGRIDGIVGGFPCKDLSLGKGHRTGLEGKESGKVFEFLRLAEEYARLADEAGNPRWLVLENSAELLKFNGGRDFATLAHLLEELGYGWAYRVVDARYFGSPQWRRRVIVVGCAGGDPRPAGQVLGLTGPGATALAPGEDRRPEPGSSPTPVAVGGELVRVWRKSANPQVNIKFGYEGGYRENWKNDGSANALTVFDGGNAARQKHLIAQNGGIRTATLREWERLQGFPDDWTVPAGSDGNRYQAIGNSMHVGMAHWLGQQISDVHSNLPVLV